MNDLPSHSCPLKTTERLSNGATPSIVQLNMVKQRVGTYVYVNACMYVYVSACMYSMYNITESWYVCIF